MLVRRLVAADVDAYRRLMLEAYARHPEAFTSSAEERAALPVEWWRQRLDHAADAPQQVFGAFIDDRLIGSVGLLFDARLKSRHKAELFGMYVADTARGQGAGHALVDAAIRAAIAREATVLQLTVTEGNRSAERLYDRCGFEVFGIEPLAVRIDGRYLSKVHRWRRLYGS
ncbi:Protein N-acetyltransferase, RimJ/RimL family [Burkholderiales bacterium 8X]|nr:Protein N-acetyltransferase, RimJ/RimL family [Burkholderiales bacterium 8X]